MFNRALALGAMLLSVLATAPAVADAAVPLALGSSVTAGQPSAAQDRHGSRGARSSRNTRDARQDVTILPEQIRTDAQAALTAAGVTTCTVTEANLLGNDANNNKVYEAACAAGPGYMVSTAVPPLVADCLMIDYQADAANAAAVAAAGGQPPAETHPRCRLPANDNHLAVLTSYATEAGVSCTVDEAAIVGQAGGNIVYEIGCAGVDGLWLEKTPTGWKKSPCLLLAQVNQTCRYTTAAESAATVKGWLAGSDAANCDVTQARYMGANANGSFYEVKCAAGDGYVARFNEAQAVQQTYPCAEAQRIGGGCTLTQVPAAPEAATQE